MVGKTLVFCTDCGQRLRITMLKEELEGVKEVLLERWVGCSCICFGYSGKGSWQTRPLFKGVKRAFCYDDSVSFL